MGISTVVPMDKNSQFRTHHVGHEIHEKENEKLR